jgi:AraC family transcriptional regulator, transcriptional activator of the genes for pyochelin and ferripyochelin receptors
MHDAAIQLRDVPETMLWTLHNRANEAKRPDARLGDCQEREPAAAWQQVDLRDGLWISKLELSPQSGRKLHYHKQPAMIDFGFILGGQLHHNLKTDVMGGRVTAGVGMAGIGYFPGHAGVMEVQEGKTLKVLHVHVTPERLNRMLGAEIGAIPPGFRLIVEGRASGDFMSKNTMDPLMQATALDVFNGRYHGMPQYLYLEGKAMELISLQLGRLMSQGTNQKTRVLLSRNEKQRIRAARDFLVRDLSAPPSLNEIGDSFCLSQNKLQLGFRELYGGSVFGCLREYKMQRARQLFNRAEMNVSQVAWEVGYTNVSQFTKAYKKRFGVLPKHYRRSVLDCCVQVS